MSGRPTCVLPGVPMRPFDVYTATDEDDEYDEWWDFDDSTYVKRLRDPGHYPGPDSGDWHAGLLEECDDVVCIDITTRARTCG